MSERKTPTRHPSTAIPAETIEEIAYRVYLGRLDPPMTPEESVATVRRDLHGAVTTDDAKRRHRSKIMEPLVRECLRAMWDMGMIKP